MSKNSQASDILKSAPRRTKPTRDPNRGGRSLRRWLRQIAEADNTPDAADLRVLAKALGKRRLV